MTFAFARESFRRLRSRRKAIFQAESFFEHGIIVAVSILAVGDRL